MIKIANKNNSNWVLIAIIIVLALALIAVFAFGITGQAVTAITEKTITLNEGASKTFDLMDSKIKVTLTAVTQQSSSNYAVVVITDGISGKELLSKKIQEGQSVAGSFFSVFAQSISYSAKAGVKNKATFAIKYLAPAPVNDYYTKAEIDSLIYIKTKSEKFGAGTVSFLTFIECDSRNDTIISSNCQVIYQKPEDSQFNFGGKSVYTNPDGAPNPRDGSVDYWKYYCGRLPTTMAGQNKTIGEAYVDVQITCLKGIKISPKQ